jgi:hypothetical protein
LPGASGPEKLCISNIIRVIPEWATARYHLEAPTHSRNIFAKTGRSSESIPTAVNNAQHLRALETNLAEAYTVSYNFD